MLWLIGVEGNYNHAIIGAIIDKYGTVLVSTATLITCSYVLAKPEI